MAERPDQLWWLILPVSTRRGRLCSFIIDAVWIHRGGRSSSAGNDIRAGCTGTALWARRYPARSSDDKVYSVCIAAYTARAGLLASTKLGDSYDNAMAENIVLYKAGNTP